MAVRILCILFQALVAGGLSVIEVVLRTGAAVGGVSAANLAEYLALPQVLACGGSWLTPRPAIAEGNYQIITDLAAEAVAIAKQARG